MTYVYICGIDSVGKMKVRDQLPASKAHRVRPAVMVFVDEGCLLHPSRIRNSAKCMHAGCRPETAPLIKGHHYNINRI